MKDFQEISGNFRLSRKQEQAILELVTPPAKTIEVTAKKIGVTERTLYNWLKLPRFEGRLKQEREKVRAEGFNSLKATLSEAVGVLRELLNSESDSIKLKSAQAVIDYNVKIAQIEELEERLSKLESLNK